MEEQHLSYRSEGDEIIPGKPKTPDIKPQPEEPEIKRKDKPEVSPDIPEKPEMPVPAQPAKPEIKPGKTKNPDVPSPDPRKSGQ